MIRIECPICGSRAETEFTYGGDADVRRPEMDETEQAPWMDYVFKRDNPRGWHKEYWHHAQGCRQWLIVERNTLTHEVRAISLAQQVFRDEKAAGAQAKEAAE